MDGIQHGQVPFNGNYVDHEGKIRNIDGFAIIGDGIQFGQVPFNGNFYGASGQVKNVDSL